MQHLLSLDGLSLTVLSAQQLTNLRDEIDDELSSRSKRRFVEFFRADDATVKFWTEDDIAPIKEEILAYCKKYGNCWILDGRTRKSLKIIFNFNVHLTDFLKDNPHYIVVTQPPKKPIKTDAELSSQEKPKDVEKKVDVKGTPKLIYGDTDSFPIKLGKPVTFCIENIVSAKFMTEDDISSIRGYILAYCQNYGNCWILSGSDTRTSLKIVFKFSTDFAEFLDDNPHQHIIVTKPIKQSDKIEQVSSLEKPKDPHKLVTLEKMSHECVKFYNEDVVLIREEILAKCQKYGKCEFINGTFTPTSLIILFKDDRDLTDFLKDNPHYIIVIKPPKTAPTIEHFSKGEASAFPGGKDEHIRVHLVGNWLEMYCKDIAKFQNQALDICLRYGKCTIDVKHNDKINIVYEDVRDARDFLTRKCDYRNYFTLTV